MFNLEKAISKWRKSLRKNQSLEDGYITELESHLRDEIEKEILSGIVEKEAFSKAIKSIGDTEKLAGEYYKSNRKSNSGKMPWQESVWLPVLLWSNFKIAFRKIKSNKGTSLVHFGGLSIGLVVMLIIAMFIKTEFSFDRYHKDLDRIHLVYWHDKAKSNIYGTTPPILAKTLRTGFPQIEALAQVSEGSDAKLYRNGNIQKIDGFFYAEPQIFDILNLKINSGSVNDFDRNINSVLLSASTARKLFNNVNPVGEILTFSDSGNRFDVTVAGIFEDTPENTQFKPEYIVNFKVFYNSLPESWRDLWGLNNPITYIKLQPGVGKREFEDQIKLIRQQNSNNTDSYFSLIPLKDVHLYSNNIRGFYGIRGSITKIHIYGIIGLLTLFVACINFINLHTAKSITRAKEVGVRKVIGAGRFQIIKQIMSESVLITVISLLIALSLIYFLLPLFNEIFNRSFNLLSFATPDFLLQLILLVTVVSLLSGSYAAFFMSKFQPVEIFRGKLKLSKSGANFRKGLITIQFIIFTGMLICSYIIFSQIDYVVNSNPGYEKDQLLSLTLPNHKYSSRCESFMNDIKRESVVADVSITSFVPPTLGNSLTTEIPHPQNREEMVPVNLLFADQNYISTLGIELVEGRYLSANDTTKNVRNVVLNEEAVKILGLQNPIGETLEMDEREYIIRGIIKDFRLQSSYYPVPPLIIINKRQFVDKFAIRLAGNNINAAMEHLTEIWKEHFPDVYMDYKFQDEEFESVYKDDLQFSTLIYFFTAVSIFIALMGLSGMIALATRQKLKEIGIRKVLGATTGSIIMMMSKEVIVITAASFILVIPLTLYLMNKWLENFANKIYVSPVIFLFAGLTTLSITLLTVYIRVISVANRKPSEFLRYE